jgi:hypothetical protein
MANSAGSLNSKMAESNVFHLFTDMNLIVKLWPLVEQKPTSTNDCEEVHSSVVYLLFLLTVIIP